MPSSRREDGHWDILDAKGDIKLPQWTCQTYYAHMNEVCVDFSSVPCGPKINRLLST